MKGLKRKWYILLKQDLESQERRMEQVSLSYLNNKCFDSEKGEASSFNDYCANWPFWMYN